MRAQDVCLEKKNHLGYPDSTVYQAMKRMQRQEFGYRPVVYICSPYRGNTVENVDLARRLCALAVTRKKIPLAPHLFFPQFMDDTDLNERALAMFMNRILLTRCEAVWAYAPRITQGMKDELTWASAKGLPVHFFNEVLEEVDG